MCCCLFLVFDILLAFRGWPTTLQLTTTRAPADTLISKRRWPSTPAEGQEEGRCRSVSLSGQEVAGDAKREARSAKPAGEYEKFITRFPPPTHGVVRAGQLDLGSSGHMDLARASRYWSSYKESKVSVRRSTSGVSRYGLGGVVDFACRCGVSALVQRPITRVDSCTERTSTLTFPWVELNAVFKSRQLAHPHYIRVTLSLLPLGTAVCVLQPRTETVLRKACVCAVYEERRMVVFGNNGRVLDAPPIYRPGHSTITTPPLRVQPVGGQSFCAHSGVPVSIYTDCSPSTQQHRYIHAIVQAGVESVFFFSVEVASRHVSSRAMIALACLIDRRELSLKTTSKTSF